MEDREEQFLKAVLEPVQTQHLPHGQDLLKEALGHTATLIAPPPGDPLEAVTARMERTAGTFARRARISFILIALTALAAAIIGVISPWAIRDAVGSTNAIRMPGGPRFLFGRGLISAPLFARPTTELVNERLAARSSPGDLAILFGDTDQSGSVDPWKAMWLSHPDDATLYSRYALACLRANGTLPDDYVATGERLDPGNGWYRFLRGAVDWKDPILGKNPPANDSAFKLIQESIDMPTFDSRRGDFLARQVRVLPTARTYAEVIQQQAFLEKSATDLHSPTLRILTRLPENFAATRRATADPAMLEQVWMKCARKLADESRYAPYQDLLVRDGMLGRGYTNIVMPPGSHVTKDEWARFLKFQKDLGRLPATPIQRAPVSFSPLISVARLELLPTEAQVQPVVHASRATIERLTLRQGLFLCLLALVACGLNHLQWRKTISPLARRMTDLLTKGDRVWIILIGCLLPLGLYVAAIRTPGYGIFYREIGSGQLRSYQMEVLAMAIASIVFSLGMVRWRLAKRGAVIGFRPPGFRPGGFFAVTALISFGTAWVDSSRLPYLSLTNLNSITWLLLWIALSWPFLLFIGTLRSGSERRLHRTTISRALWGPLTLTCAIFATMILLSYAEDRYWTARDTEETPQPEWGGNLTATKQRAADDLHRRLLEVLDSK